MRAIAPSIAQIVLLAAALPAAAASGQEANDLDRIRSQIDALAQRTIRTAPLAGLAIGVARGDQILIAKGYGFADLENDVPVTEHTVFRLASVTKQFTAAAVMQLVEEGALSLEDPLARLWPEFPTGGRTVTLRQLLNHTSGIPSVTSLPEFESRSETIHSRDELLDLVKGQPFDFEPGQEFRYNNTGFILAGEILGRACSKPYDHVIAERIFAPLGMSDSCYGWEQPILKRRAQGYRVVDGRLANDAVIDMVIPGGAGALASSVVDLLKWATAVQRCAIVGDASQAEMTAPTRLSDGVLVDYGFGLVTDRSRGQPRVAHGGNIQGFSTWLEWYPDLELSIAVLINTEGNGAQELAGRIARLLVPAPAATRAGVAATPGLLARCAGTFARGEQRLTLSVTGEGLSMQLGEQPRSALQFLGERDNLVEFQSASSRGPRVVVVRDRRAVDHVTLVSELVAMRFRPVAREDAFKGSR